jgi:uncharacterized lipoprotein YajG
VQGLAGAVPAPAPPTFQTASKRLFEKSLVVILVILLALAGCALPSNQTTVRGEQTAGSDLPPDRVAENFFDDLQRALKDQQLASDDKRGQWAEQLASYFAPSERDNQRIALRSMLDNFVAGLGELESNEQMTIELKFDGVETVSENGNRALVRLVNGSINVLITRTTEAGAVTLYKDDVPLAKIIGGENGTVPVVRIGRAWYLTEG